MASKVVEDIGRITLTDVSENASIFLDNKFRELLIKKGIKKSGSMRRLGRVMGYPGVTPSWNVKQMLFGKQGIPFFRLKRLCDFLDLKLEDVEKHVVSVR